MATWKDCLWVELFDDEAGDGRPVSIIHVDDALFARACAKRGLTLSDTDARHAFLTAFPNRLNVQRWLVGSESPGEALLPLLVLCCLAASEAADSDDNDYRARMRDMMGWEDRIINCEALPRLWARLAALTRKRAERTPTRPLILPDPRFRTQIGHAIELTFPSRNDSRRLLHELSGARFDLDAPRAVLAWLAPLIARHRFSPTFEETFNSFRDAWLNAERSLGDHRFWSGWKLATQTLRAELDGPGMEIVADEWGIRQIIDARNERAIDLEDALRSRTLPGALVAAATKTHVIPLIEGEWGRLRWLGEERGKSPIAALIRQRAFSGRYQTLNCARVVGAEGWGLTFDVTGVFGDRAPTVDRDRLIDVGATSCTRVDGGVLARPALPFLIEATGHVGSVTMTGALADQLSLERIDQRSWRVTPRAPLTGEIKIVAEPRAGGAPLERGLRLRRSILAPTFRDTIPERLYDSDPDPAPTWPTTPEASDVVRPLASPGALAPTPALLDLVEFLAIRTAPLPLGGFSEIVRAAIGDGDVNPWDVIQSLRDAGVVRVLDVRGWRGRVLLSQPPSGAITRTPTGWAMMFEGCLSETWLARLGAAVGRHGLDIEARAGAGLWSPPTPAVFSQALTPLLEVSSEVEAPTGFARSNLSLVTSLLVAPPLTATEARPSRRAVPLAGDHAPLAFLDSDQANVTPVWAVRHGASEMIWRHRDDAVLDAYTAIGARPFRVNAERWAAVSARLPTHVARWLRLTLGVAAGPMPDGAYGYARDAVAERELARIAPSLFGRPASSDIVSAKPRARQWRSVAVATSKGPRVRPLWDVIRATRGGE